MRKAAQKLPSLKAFKLPVKISCAGVADEVDAESGEDVGIYWVTIRILGDEEPVRLGKQGSFKIGGCTFWTSAISRLLGGRNVTDPIYGYYDYPKANSISFDVLLHKEAERTEYAIVIRNILDVVRSYIRKVLSDFDAIKEGFEGQE
ncbi:MAG: hypothetical protein HY664_01990 [Chloroflexi bacterium]|nr:hypothetical protein [Chloroflexota bacterium]